MGSGYVNYRHLHVAPPLIVLRTRQRNVDRPGSSGSEGAATSTPTDSRAEPLRRGNTEAQKDYTVESSAAAAQDRREYNTPSDETSSGERNAKGVLPTEDMTLEQVRMSTTMLKYSET
jgi:hypothetical protein